MLCEIPRNVFFEVHHTNRLRCLFYVLWMNTEEISLRSHADVDLLREIRLDAFWDSREANWQGPLPRDHPADHMLGFEYKRRLADYNAAQAADDSEMASRGGATWCASLLALRMLLCYVTSM